MPDQASGGLLSPFLQRKRIEQAVPFIRGRTLDYGCGNGALYARLSPQLQQRYVGYDVDSEVIASAQARFGVGRFTHQANEIRGERFDSVVSLAVIEHVPSVRQYLSTLASLLADGGHVVLTSPRPSVDLIHRAGARSGLFSREASEEHNEYVTRSSIDGYCSDLELELKVFRPFLLGANQLFVLGRKS